jgi:lysyl-tRNA synthetase class 1
LPEADRARFEQRAQCVWNWVEQYAPEDFRYRIRAEPVTRELPEEQRQPLARLVEILQADASPSEADLGGKMSEMSKSGVDMKVFFPVVYDLLLGRDRGPKMSTLLAIMTPARALPLLEPSLG